MDRRQPLVQSRLSRRERRELQSQIRRVTAGFCAFLALTIGLVAFYAINGVDGILSVSAGRFGHGVSNGLWIVAIPPAATVLLGFEWLRLRRQRREAPPPHTQPDIRAIRSKPRN